MVELWTQLGSGIAGLFIAWAMFQQHMPSQLQNCVDRLIHKLVTFLNPYVQITFHEFTGKRFNRSEAYDDIQNYLSENSSAHAKRLKADVYNDSSPLVLSMDDHESVADQFNGITVWWSSNKNFPRQSISFYPASDERRYYKLTFHKRYREIVTNLYVKHVLKEGKSVAVRKRQRKLYTNNPSKNWYDWNGTKWSHMPFEHPATFYTLAMATNTKEQIMKDLIKFSKGKAYYEKIGKAWKRGYLLYGPPGTGKSSMIAAIANLLDYDVYDLELTTVKDNSELRKLLTETKSKSVIVIEDIDCSLDLTGKRMRKKKEKDGDEKVKDPVSDEERKKEQEDSKGSKVTLSGLLNVIDGIWSACAGEKIFVFTTNYVDKLDQALIRRGRMDKYIEMSYCCFEAFKVLAKNYLDIESHEMFPRIDQLLVETNMTPADVAENLMPKSDEKDVETCLENLIKALEFAKEEARKKSEEEEAAKLKAEQEEEKNKSVETEEK